MKKLIIIFFLLISVLPFWRYFLKNEIPFNGNYLVSIYHPFKAETLKTYPNGMPSKPFFDDQLRQYFPYLEFVRKSFVQGKMPWQNPYQFSGVPFIANWQTAVFFPTNILLFVLPTADYWTLTRILPFFLCLLFTYIYLRSINLSGMSSVFGAALYTFSGTFITYSQETIYNNFIFCFLPLSLFALKRLSENIEKKYSLLFLIVQILTILTGFIQQVFYQFIFIGFYLLYKTVSFRKNELIKSLKSRKFIICFSILILSIVICLPYLIPGFDFYSHSTRRFADYSGFIRERLLPFYSLFTFYIPDFLGNPGSHNWFGFTIGTYAEKAAWIAPVFLPFLILSILNYQRNSESVKHKKKFLFFIFILTILYVFYSPMSLFCVNLKIPIIGTAMFNRLIFVNTFVLVLLSSFGFEEAYKNNEFKKIKMLITFMIMVLFFWFAYNFARNTTNSLFLHPIPEINRNVATNNMILPFLFSITTFLIIMISHVLKRTKTLSICILLVILFGMYEFAKYTPFSNRRYFYPSHPLIKYLQEKTKENARVLFVNKEMEYHWDDLATYYRVYTISGYDPLNYKKYNDMLFYLDHPISEQNNRRYDAIVEDLTDNFQAKIVVLKKLNVKYLVTIDGDLDSKQQDFTNSFVQEDSFGIYKIWRWK
jgi:hypothetical protein